MIAGREISTNTEISSPANIQAANAATSSSHRCASGNSSATIVGEVSFGVLVKNGSSFFPVERRH